MLVLAIIFPWLYFFIKGRINEGFIALLLQCSVVGWLPASVWAMAIYNLQKTNIAFKQFQGTSPISNKPTPNLHKKVEALNYGSNPQESNQFNKLKTLCLQKQLGLITETEYDYQKNKLLV